MSVLCCNCSRPAKWVAKSDHLNARFRTCGRHLYRAIEAMASGPVTVMAVGNAD